MSTKPRHSEASANGPAGAHAAAAPADDCRPPWTRWVGVMWTGAISILLIVALADAPAPGLTGDGLFIAAGMALVLASGLFELRRHREPVPRPETLAGIGLGFALTACAEGAGTALIGCFAAIGAISHTLEARRAALFAAPVALAVNGALIVAGDAGAAAYAWVNWGLLSSFVLGVLIRGGRIRHREAGHLLEEARRTRAAQAEAAMLAERGRIARELHDVLAHTLSGLAVQLQGAQLLAAETGADPRLAEAIGRSRRQARSGLAEARSAIEALRGADLPGPDGLAELVHELGDERGIDCEMEVAGEPRELPPQQRLALFRVGQEALTNVRRHADPDSVAVRLEYERDGTSLLVEDRKAGATARCDGQTGGGYGISGMCERAELLGGTLDADPTAAGFRVRLWLPRSGSTISASP